MIQTLLYWMRERNAIYLKRQRGEPKPWTSDPILQSYRFCNVYREQDTVTKWIAKNWRDPYDDIDPDLWFAMCVARLVNWPETLEEIGYPVPWEPSWFCDVLHGRRYDDKKVFSGAYIVSTNGWAMDKADYLAQRVLTPLWEARATLRPLKADTLASYHARLTRFNGMGSFMAAQVVADLKYVSPLSAAKDWYVWAASGPGSRRGLNRVLGRPVRSPWKEANWLKELQILHDKILRVKLGEGMPTLHAQDLQNCLCEFDKYMRTHNGEGRPRSTYPGLA